MLENKSKQTDNAKLAVVAQFKKGDICQAKDFANNWYKSRILEVDEETNKVKVHFLGWNSRYDQWFDTFSNDLKPIDATEGSSKKKNVRRQASEPQAPKKQSQVPPASAAVAVEQKSTEDKKSKAFLFEPGTRVLAKWKLDDLFYPAHILRNVTKGSIQYYDVKFQADGVKQMIRATSVRELTEEDQAILDKYKLEQEQLKLLPKDKLASDPVTTDVSDKGGDEARRAEAELLLAIQNPLIKRESDEATEAVDSLAATSDSISQRKSSRVKKLKTFKDEIVYYPPSSSKSYNLKLEAGTCVQEGVPTKRKLSTSLNRNDPGIIEVEAEKTEAVVDVVGGKKLKADEGLKETVMARQQQSAEKLRKKLEDTKKARIQSYLQKSVKMARTKKQMIGNASKRLTNKEIDQNRQKKKDVIKELIESSQQQLRKQQEMIESQLKQHRHEKTKRKMLKLLRKQRMMDEQRNFAMESMNTSESHAWLGCKFDDKNSLDTDASGLYQNNDPIRCNFSNCEKTFRKQSLLEYHLKYHHYVDMKTFNSFDFEQIILSTPSIQMETLATKQRASKQKLDSITDEMPADKSNLTDNKKIEDDPDWKDIYSNDKNEDPYDVVHCACGNHKSVGLMIQCDICLCWQHGGCLGINSNSQVPDCHVCWICSEPGNRLRELKYRSWMQVKNEKKSREILDSNNADAVPKLSKQDTAKLNLINLCSKKYFNLNLLMHVIECQQALLARMEKEKSDCTGARSVSDKIEKLLMNILHLQECATTKFDEFNKKLDEFEEKYQHVNKNALPRFFNLQELYRQLQSFVYT